MIGQHKTIVPVTILLCDGSLLLPFIFSAAPSLVGWGNVIIHSVGTFVSGRRPNMVGLCKGDPPEVINFCR